MSSAKAVRSFPFSTILKACWGISVKTVDEHLVETGGLMARPLRLRILIPVFNDWDAVGMLLDRLDQAFVGQAVVPSVLLVDDASTLAVTLVRKPRRSLAVVEVLPMKRNLGHQRAIAMGLCHLQAAGPACDAILVMDADGEDDPSDTMRLIGRFKDLGSRSVVFAERTRRSEGIVFRCFYVLYRALHRMLTGFDIHFGNFSILPFNFLESMVTSPDLWNNYAASILKMHLPYAAVPTQRAHRYCGQSHMNLPALFLHGLGAISVFAESAGVRLLLAAGGVTVGMVGVLALVIALRVGTTMAIPGWATFAGGLVLIMLLQVVVAAFLVVLFILNARNNVNPGPEREFLTLVRPAYEI